MTGSGFDVVNDSFVRRLIGVANRIARVAGKNFYVGLFNYLALFLAVREDGGTATGGTGRHPVHAHGDVVQLLSGLELGGSLESLQGSGGPHGELSLALQAAVLLDVQVFERVLVREILVAVVPVLNRPELAES